MTDTTLKKKTRVDYSNPLFFVELKPGDVLGGDFEIKSLIAKGGMGAVYEAHQKSLERQVALKILPPILAQDPSYIARFQVEAKAAAKLEHPGIVPIYDIGSDNDIHFFIMALVRGKTLEDIIDDRKKSLLRTRKTMPLDEALGIVTQVAKVLAFAHSKGVVHRDIKPSNIMIDNKGKIVVTDFGLAKVSGTDKKARAEEEMVMGTPLFMSPEQARGEKVDHRADLYSLGVILYVLVSGRHPLPTGLMETDTEVIEAVREGRTIPIREVMPHIDERLQAVIEMAMAPNPTERYQTAQALISDIDRFRNGVSVFAKPSARVLVTSAPETRRLFLWPLVMRYGMTLALLTSIGLNVYLLTQMATAKRAIGTFTRDLLKLKSLYRAELGENANAYFLLAQGAMREEDFETAEKYLRKFMAEFPNDPRIAQAKEFLEIIRQKNR